MKSQRDDSVVLRLILKGRVRGKSGRPDKDDEKVAAYFNRVTSRDVMSLLNIVEFTDNAEKRKKATRVLSAYLSWAARHVETTADGKPLSPLLAHFGELTANLLSGFRSDDAGDDEYTIPFLRDPQDEQAPNIAFGWSLPIGAKSKQADQWVKALRIAMYFSRKEKNGFTTEQSIEGAKAIFSLERRRTLALLTEGRAYLIELQKVLTPSEIEQVIDANKGGSG